MKKSLLVFLLMILSFSAFAKTLCDSQILIIVEVTDKKQPRNIPLSPIEGVYDSGFFFLDFLEDVGEVIIYVMNTSTGESISLSTDSVDGSATLNLSSGSPGSYSIIITAESGGIYQANFVVS